MRCLIIGGDGMLGHQLLKSLRERHDARVTLRRPLREYRRHALFTPDNAFDNVDVRNPERLSEVLESFRPDVVVNAAGVIKQRAEAGKPGSFMASTNPKRQHGPANGLTRSRFGFVDDAPAIRAAEKALSMLEVNAVFPHRLRLLCAAAGARLVHVSTDCVFSGRRGNSTERDLPDAEDLYGRSKLLGEIDETPCAAGVPSAGLARGAGFERGIGCISRPAGDNPFPPPAVTLRTSIIGLELSHRTSLVEWFLAQRGTIRGYTRAVYSGVTTTVLARVIEYVLIESPDLRGLWHVASCPISKHDLLCRLAARLERNDITIEPDDEFLCDRSLDGSAFTARTGWRAPDWDPMLEELADQIRVRDRERRRHAA